MKIRRLETPVSYMLELKWDKQTIDENKVFLKNWDSRHISLYNNKPKYIVEADYIEREHLRNCIKFWEERLSNED